MLVPPFRFCWHIARSLVFKSLHFRVLSLSHIDKLVNLTSLCA
jgi:hypothetical protein